MPGVLPMPACPASAQRGVGSRSSNVRISQAPSSSRTAPPVTGSAAPGRPSRSASRAARSPPPTMAVTGSECWHASRSSSHSPRRRSADSVTPSPSTAGPAGSSLKRWALRLIWPTARSSVSASSGGSASSSYSSTWSKRTAAPPASTKPRAGKVASGTSPWPPSADVPRSTTANWPSANELAAGRASGTCRRTRWSRQGLSNDTRRRTNGSPARSSTRVTVRTVARWAERAAAVPAAWPWPQRRPAQRRRRNAGQQPPAGWGDHAELPALALGLGRGRGEVDLAAQPVHVEVGRVGVVVDLESEAPPGGVDPDAVDHAAEQLAAVYPPEHLAEPRAGQLLGVQQRGAAAGLLGVQQPAVGQLQRHLVPGVRHGKVQLDQARAREGGRVQDRHRAPRHPPGHLGGGALGEARAELARLGQPDRDLVGDRVGAAAGDGVVPGALDQPPPRQVEERRRPGRGV